jgi:tetratricopeptide (TPR) repeat protein
MTRRTGDPGPAPSDDRQTLSEFPLPPGDRAAADRWLAVAARAAEGGDWTAAEDAFLQGVASDPSDGRCHGGLAIVAIRQGDWPRAVAHGQTAVSLTGAGVEVHNNLGWALEQIGRPHEAVAAYRRAFEADPTRVEPIHHLLRLGELGQPTEPLETLQRLDLYQAIAQHLRQAPCRHTFAASHEWADQRRAPWAGVGGWLVELGLRCDCEVLRTLAQGDRHLSTTVVSGIILGDPRTLSDLLRRIPALRLLGPEDSPAPNLNFEAQEPLGVRFDPRVGRGEVPPQRAHAVMLVGLFAEILPLLGPDGALVLSVDTAQHMEPRRLWILSARADVEIQGAWTLEGDDRELLFTPGAPMPLAELPLEIPGADAASLQDLVHRTGMDGAVKVEEGLILADGAAVAARAEPWTRFLTRLTRWIPTGAERVAAWRDGGADLGVALRREGDLVARPLRSVWPPDQNELDLPVAPELQVLGRALFEAPRARSLLADPGSP